MVEARPQSPEKREMFDLFNECLEEAAAVPVYKNASGALLVSPEGVRSELQDELLYKVVRTPSFKNWFGDWENNPESASEAVYSSTKEPQMVFHATPNDIPNEEGLRARLEKPGETRMYFVHFSSDRKNALEWGDIKKTTDSSSDQGSVSVYPCFLNIRTKDHTTPLTGIINSSPTRTYYAVRYNNQIMHVPLNLIAEY